MIWLTLQQKQGLRAWRARLALGAAHVRLCPGELSTICRLLRSTIAQLLTDCGRGLLPPTCLLCGADGGADRLDLCEPCLGSLPRAVPLTLPPFARWCARGSTPIPSITASRRSSSRASAPGRACSARCWRAPGGAPAASCPTSPCPCRCTCVDCASVVTTSRPISPVSPHARLRYRWTRARSSAGAPPRYRAGCRIGARYQRRGSLPRSAPAAGAARRAGGRRADDGQHGCCCRRRTQGGRRRRRRAVGRGARGAPAPGSRQVAPGWR